MGGVNQEHYWGAYKNGVMKKQARESITKCLCSETDGGMFFWVRRRNIHCCFFQGICFWAVWLFQPAAWAPEGPPWNTPGLVRSLQKRLQKAPQRAPGGPRAAPGPSGRPGDAPGALWGPPRAAGFKSLSLGLLGRQALRLWEGVQFPGFFLHHFHN